MIRLLFTVAFVLAVSSPSLAQQQQQPASNMALQINGAVINLALELDQSRQMITSLQNQVTDSQARIKELEAQIKKPDEPKN